MSDPALEGIARRALDFVRPGSVLGLGTGRAATAFVEALGVRVREGLRIRGVPTSEVTAKLARELGIPLVGLDDVEEIDVTFDGADEVDDRLDMIKGYGGALVREKIVAASSRERVMLVGAEKLVRRVGERGKLPVEVVPFGAALARRRLTALGLRPVVRDAGGKPYVTDNANWILDCGLEPVEDPVELEDRILAIPGVLGTGFFLGMADSVLVQNGSEVELRERPARKDRKHPA
jgi:ribose 5-phosphate isomerase A